MAVIIVCTLLILLCIGVFGLMSRAREHEMLMRVRMIEQELLSRKCDQAAEEGIEDVLPVLSGREQVLSEMIEEAGLTSREAEVFHIIVRGHNAHYVADTLCVSFSTAKTHTCNIYKKLDIHSQQDLIEAVEHREAHLKKTRERMASRKRSDHTAVVSPCFLLDRTA